MRGWRPGNQPSKSMHCAEAGAQLFRKLSSPYCKTSIFAWRLKRSNLGVPKTVSLEMCRAKRLFLKCSNMSLKTRNMVMDAKLQMQKRTKVAYVCHFRAFQDRKRPPQHPTSSIEKRKKTRVKLQFLGAISIEQNTTVAWFDGRGAPGGGIIKSQRI